MNASFRNVSLVSLLISSLSIGLISSVSCTRRLVGSDGLNSNGDDSDSLDEKELARWYTNNGYEIVGPNTDPLDMGFFTEWAEGDSITGDEKDREEEIELERSLWQSVHSVRTMDMNAWLHKAATTIFSKKRR
jgi:hypothetical protein